MRPAPMPDAGFPSPSPGAPLPLHCTPPYGVTCHLQLDKAVFPGTASSISQENDTPAYREILANTGKHREIPPKSTRTGDCLACRGPSGLAQSRDMRERLRAWGESLETFFLEVIIEERRGTRATLTRAALSKGRRLTGKFLSLILEVMSV